MKTVFAILLLQAVSSVLPTEIDYYWRNYNGGIPSDAVQAGLDKSGKPIYIGQGFFLNTGLIPGTLHAGSTNFKVTAVGIVFSTNKYVKILCSKHPNNFRWITVNYSDIALLTNVHLVEGGVETDSIVHIGRVYHGGDLEIGKIYNLAPYQCLAVPNSEGSMTQYQHFDILTYSSCRTCT